jgi:signal transduction histidine kinase
MVLASVPVVATFAVINRDAQAGWAIADPSYAVAAVIYGLMGGLLGALRPRNALGWVFLATAILLQGAALSSSWAVYGLITSPGATGAAFALWLSLTLAATNLVPVFPLLLFPTGRFVDGRTRLVGIAAGGTLITLAFSLLTGHFPPPGFPSIYQRTVNPLDHIGNLDPGYPFAALMVTGVVAMVLLLMRFRRARGETRQEYLWVVVAMVAIVLANLADAAARSSGSDAHVITTPILSLSNVLLPVSMAIAVLRYRLWDIDIIVSRALVYLALTGCVVGIYVMVVGWLGTVFRTGGNLVFSLVATGIVAVAFQPLRERIQRGVNRLLYGERDEPYSVISRLGRRLEETLAPETVLLAITQTVREALKLPYSAIALPLSQVSGQIIVAEAGLPVANPVRVPLIYQHATIGELLLAPRTPGEGFSVADRRLLDDLARQAGIAVHAVQLTTELQQARERLVAAREEERRRLRRDLHDGLGSQLAALTMQAGALRGLIERDPVAAQAEVVELRAQLRAAIASIRIIVHGLRPPAIDELGLLMALRERVRQYNTDELAVDLDAPANIPALPAAVEVAVYRIVEEALANVVRHARASRAVVRLMADDAVELTIEDDGIGIDPRAGAGVGLLSMRERAEEVGGRCVIAARPSGGSRVTVELPLNRGGVDDDTATADPHRR